jgi:hypothetical protein
MGRLKVVRSIRFNEITGIYTKIMNKSQKKNVEINVKISRGFAISNRLDILTIMYMLSAIKNVSPTRSQMKDRT